MGLFNFKREIKWDKDVMKVTDSLSSIWDSVVDEMSDKMKSEQTSEVLRHFEIDMSDLREYLLDKEEWKRKQAEAIPRWIPVAERLPEEGVSVIAYEKQGFPYIDWIRDGEWVIASNEYAEVTHWMPLPEPPKEEDKE